MTFPAKLPIPPEVLKIASKLEDSGHETWCVGGAIRDALLGIDDPEHDPLKSEFDLTTAAPPAEVQKLFKRTVPVGIEHGTVGVLDTDNRLYEVTTFRKDIQTDGRHAVVEFGVSLMDDLARRDFTINAIAYHPLRHEWRDPFQGEQDLAKRVIRSVGDPNWRFQEDYLRILRALRFSARFGFRIEPRTLEAAKANAQGLAQLSAERVREEWFKGIRTAKKVSKLIALWRDIGASRIWLPETVAGSRGQVAARSRARQRAPGERSRVAADSAQVLQQGHRTRACHRQMAGPVPGREGRDGGPAVAGSGG
jgi:tRNA nucleotidyltransferase (CCA-adding enzyme)